MKHSRKSFIAPILLKNMGKIEFVKIKGKIVAFIDETAHDPEPISVFSCPVILKCGCDVLPGQMVSPNERGEIVVSDGSNICGIVIEPRGNHALVQIDW